MVHILRDIAGKCVVHMTKCDVLGSWKIYFTTRIIEKKKKFLLIKVTMVTSRIWANLILNYFLIYCHQNYSQEDGYIGQQIRYRLILK